MLEILKHKLYDYIRENNPEIIFSLEADCGITKYITEKVSSINDLLEQLKKESNPPYIVEEICFNELIKDLKPSRFNYISKILEEDFEFAFQQLSKLKLLQHEVVNIMIHCDPLFQSFNFNEENEDSRDLRYAVTGIISEYLDSSL